MGLGVRQGPRARSGSESHGTLSSNPSPRWRGRSSGPSPRQMSLGREAAHQAEDNSTEAGLSGKVQEGQVLRLAELALCQAHLSQGKHIFPPQQQASDLKA